MCSQCRGTLGPPPHRRQVPLSCCCCCCCRRCRRCRHRRAARPPVRRCPAPGACRRCCAWRYQLASRLVSWRHPALAPAAASVPGACCLLAPLHHSAALARGGAWPPPTEAPPGPPPTHPPTYCPPCVPSLLLTPPLAPHLQCEPQMPGRRSRAPPAGAHPLCLLSFSHRPRPPASGADSVFPSFLLPLPSPPTVRAAALQHPDPGVRYLQHHRGRRNMHRLLRQQHQPAGGVLLHRGEPRPSTPWWAMGVWGGCRGAWLNVL